MKQPLPLQERESILSTAQSGSLPAFMVVQFPVELVSTGAAGLLFHQGAANEFSQLLGARDLAEASVPQIDELFDDASSGTDAMLLDDSAMSTVCEMLPTQDEWAQLGAVDHGGQVAQAAAALSTGERTETVRDLERSLLLRSLAGVDSSASATGANRVRRIMSVATLFCCTEL